MFARWREAQRVRRRAGRPRRAVRDRRAAAQRHGLAAHGPRAQRHDAGRDHPPAAHAGPQGALDLRHRPRGHRDAERRRAHARAHEPDARGARARGVRAPRLELARGVGRDDHRPVPAARLLARLRARALHDGRRVRARRSCTCSSRCTSAATSTAPTAWSTGARSATRRSRTSRSSTSRSTTRSTRSTTRSSAAATSRSRRCARSRCSATPRSPSIPADERYRDLIGRRAIVPLVGREVPIVGDEHVEPDVGTGALKVTPGHDPNDLEIAPPPRARRDRRDRLRRPHDRPRRASATRA